jgi:adenylate cyclase
MKHWLIGILFGLLVGSAGVLLGLSPLGAAFEQSIGLSWMFQVRGSIAPPTGVVVVAMDSRTGEQLGLPTLPRDWPRSVHGELVDALIERGASVIAFDVHFGRAKDPASDQAFVHAVSRAGNVVLVELLTGKRQPITDLEGRHVGMIWEEETVPPFAALAAAARGLASFPLPKEAASVHRFWVFKESTDNAPTLPAVVLQLYARDGLAELLETVRGADPGAIDAMPNAGAALSGPDSLRDFMRGLRAVFEQSPELMFRSEKPSADAAPIGSAMALAALYAGEAHRFLNFYGPPGTILTVPYQSVLAGRDPNLPPGALDFTGKAVFVGFSDLYDPGQPDRFYTVFTRSDGVDLSGVEIAATGFANLLTDRSLKAIDTWTALGILLLFGFLLGMLMYVLPGTIGVPVAIVLAALYAVVAQHVFSEQAVIPPLATPLLVQAPAALFLGLLGQYFIERRRGQRISEAINYYLPEDIARDLVQDRLDPGKLNQVVYSTCLATDMAGFSTLAEGLPPGELAKILNDYFETLAAPLKRHGVQVTEFRADAIMCAWTSEQPSADTRRKALLAALEAEAAIEAFRRRHNMPQARLRIGLEAGWVYVGHAGGGGRFVYSIVGDSANTASRIEGLNKQMGTQVLATGNVVEGFENLVMRYLGAYQFVGKTEAVSVYEILAKREDATIQQLRLCEDFGRAFEAYRQADWAAAARGFQAIIQEYGADGPSQFLLTRCQRYLSGEASRANPGVIRMDAK